MPAPRKFKPGDIVWGAARFHHRGGYTPYKILEIVKRSYSVAPLRDDGTLGRPEVLGFRVAENWFRTKAEVDEIQYVGRHLYKIGQAVLSLRDAATLRRVAEIVGYKENE